MKVSEFIDLAITTTLAQTTVTQDSVLKFTNLGLNVLYSKFNLNNKTVLITLVEGTTQYLLPSDCINIESITTPMLYYRNYEGLLGTVIDDNDGDIDLFDVPVNVNKDTNSVYVNSNNILTVNTPSTGQVLTVVYKASPIKLTTQSLNEELELPSSMLDVLLMYVTYLGFLQNMGGTATDTGLMYQRYTQALQVLVDSGSYEKHFNIDDKFYNRGFV
jgi:hypothetical protein